MSDDRRRTDRRRYLDRVLYQSRSASGEGELSNISEKGLFVRTHRSPKHSEIVHIGLQVPAGELTLDGITRWVGRRQDGAEGFGAELVDPPASYLDLVRDLSATDVTERTPRRVAPRIDLSIPVAVEFGTTCDDGTLCDISLSGARLESTRVQPQPGARVTLVFALQSMKPFEIVARVARITDSGGYAVQFEAIDPGLKSALANAVALLSKLPDIDS
jgi:hypothetical protein